MRVAKTKALISFAVTAFVFAYADCWFSHEAGHLLCACPYICIIVMYH